MDLKWNSLKGDINESRRDETEDKIICPWCFIQLVESLPKERTAEILGRQLLRSGTSVGSNYRSACRARSIADFISKMGIVEEEVDESLYWMELLIEAGMEVSVNMEALMKEAGEILAITVASIKTAKNKKLSSRK